MRFLASVGEKLDAHDYPATNEELMADYGDLELDLPDGTETFGEAMARLGQATFQNAEQARFAAYSVVSDEAVGRKYYSDRDPTAPGEDGPEQLSF